MERSLLLAKLVMIVLTAVMMTSVNTSVLMEGDILDDLDYVRADINQVENASIIISQTVNVRRGKQEAAVKKGRFRCHSIWNQSQT